MREVVWLKDRLVSQLLDPASISSPPQAPSQPWLQRTPSHLAEAFRDCAQRTQGTRILSPHDSKRASTQQPSKHSSHLPACPKHRTRHMVREKGRKTTGRPPPPRVRSRKGGSLTSARKQHNTPAATQRVVLHTAAITRRLFLPGATTTRRLVLHTAAITRCLLPHAAAISRRLGPPTALVT